MRAYRRVTYEDRCQIQAFLQVKLSIGEVSKKLGFHKSTIFRELARNSAGRYEPKRANKLARKRFRFCRRAFRIEGALEKAILKGLCSSWSPEQVSGRLRLETSTSISHQTIYDYVKRNWSELKIYLRRYNKRGAGRLRQSR